MTVSSKRPVQVALVSLILSVVFFGISFLLGRWSGFSAISAVGWLNLSAALVWLVLCLKFYQRSLAEQEKLDAGQLSRDQATSTIFQAGSEQATLFYVAQRRLQIFEKWFIPIFSALIAAYQMGIGLYLFSAARTAIAAEELKQPLLCGICMTAIAFVSFLISRYATGMSGQPQWKPLRAGGSSLLGVAVLCFALAVALALTYLFNFYTFVNVMALVIPAVLVVLGVETALNLILDIYRPRLKGLYGRSAFDSRLLGAINEPGGILRSAADAIDYQFGFNVSQTWFYKLLEQAIVPLVLFAGTTLYLLSCIVVVAPDEQAIIEHFGNPVNDANDVRLVGPGLTFKWPWPIDKVCKYPTRRIAEISIGFVPKVDKEGRVEHVPLLWGEAHYEQEDQLLVASEQAGTKSVGGTVPVSLVIAAVPVQYRIKDLYSFVYNHHAPEQFLASICYRELTRLAASAKIEVDNEADMAHSLLGAGRAEAGNLLTTRIQKAADEAGLGVDVIFVGLQGIHPPVEVAADYQKVIGALQKKQALILQAQAERNNMLSTLVGSVQEAEALYDLWGQYQRATLANTAEDIESLGRQLDSVFEQAKGEIFKTLRESKSDAFQKATLAEATSQRFAGQLKAYRAAPQIFIQEQKLATLEEALDGIRKYVVVADPNDTQVTIIDLQEKLSPSLYELSGIQESSQQ
ncbi:MAG TPA: SPFH domain-containing protein [Sedimentisphaerales bacterium]|nr:SPFH domain-containing protein [Sedimentisphaerales bacterium]